MLVLKDECKKIGLTVSQFEQLTDTSQRTLRRWAVSHPVRLNALLDCARYHKFLIKKASGDLHLQQDLLNE